MDLCRLSPRKSLDSLPQGISNSIFLIKSSKYTTSSGEISFIGSRNQLLYLISLLNSNKFCNTKNYGSLPLVASQVAATPKEPCCNLPYIVGTNQESDSDSFWEKSRLQATLIPRIVATLLLSVS